MHQASPSLTINNKTEKDKTMNLITILLLLFLILAVVVMVTEKFGKPMSQGRQSKLMKIALILMFILIVTRILTHFYHPNTVIS